MKNRIVVALLLGMAVFCSLAAAGDAATARRYIESEISQIPTLVRAPIDVLEITAAGARWIDRDPRSAYGVIGD